MSPADGCPVRSLVSYEDCVSRNLHAPCEVDTGKRKRRSAKRDSNAPAIISHSNSGEGEDDRKNEQADTFQKAVLPVAVGLSDPDRGPLNGEEYLFLVRGERCSIPSVVVSSCHSANDCAPGKRLPDDIAKTSASCRVDWGSLLKASGENELHALIDEGLGKFALLKELFGKIIEMGASLPADTFNSEVEGLHSMPSTLDEHLWYRWCYSESGSDQSVEPSGEEQGLPPKCSQKLRSNHGGDDLATNNDGHGLYGEISENGGTQEGENEQLLAHYEDSAEYKDLMEEVSLLPYILGIDHVPR